MRNNKPSVKIEMDVKDLLRITEMIRRECPHAAAELQNRIDQAQDDADIKKLIENGVIR